MKGMNWTIGLVTMILTFVTGVQANVFNMGDPNLTNVELVTVGNSGNSGNWAGESYGGYGPDQICGAVSYEYRIGKYEVTAGQYVKFLNAVAKTDTYELYNTSMVRDIYGCQIERSGFPGNYTYNVALDMVNRPVNYVSWGDAARFCNWLYNGQPTGLQGPNTTEDGSYCLNGATTNAMLLAVMRKRNATWVIPTEDEWYKAAYHKNDGITENYFNFATSSDSVPSNDLINPDPGNSMNYYVGGTTLDDPYRTTEVGEFENSSSPYGTYDQGGNVWEWTETVDPSSWFILRGGCFYTSRDVQGVESVDRAHYAPSREYHGQGFRIAQIPEPVTVSLFGLGCLILSHRRLNVG